MDPITTPRGAPLATARAPALAYDNPQPKLPGSEADPPRQPETFVRRARRVRLGSHHLKTGYLALCTFGRGWVKEEDRIEIRMKRQTLAGELECRPQTLAALLRDLKAAGVVDFCRSKYHTIVTLFCEPRPRVSAESAPTGPGLDPAVSAENAPTGPGLDPAVSAENAPTGPGLDPAVSAENAPLVGAESALTKGSHILSEQQQHPDPPTKKQLRGIRSMGDELRAADVDPFGSDKPLTRIQADETFRERKQQVVKLRGGERSNNRHLRRQSPVLTHDAIGRIRNCPACRVLDRGAECHCSSCGWREAGCTCDFIVDLKPKSDLDADGNSPGGEAGHGDRSGTG